MALALGAELLVRGGARAAKTLGISSLVIGMTVVAYGTSAPELAASLVAAIYGHPDVTIGNVVGSNIANIGLILGTTALACPLTVRYAMIRREVSFMFWATLVFLTLAYLGAFVRGEGFLLLVALAGYNLLSLKWARRASARLRKEMASPEKEIGPGMGASLAYDIFLVIAGLILLFGGGHFLVKGAVNIARWAGLSEAVIGVTLVAIGTSLPELATSVVAALRCEIEISIGNVVGSNIFNLLGATGICATVAPFEVNAALRTFELPALFVFTVAMVTLLRSDRKIGRLQGSLLLFGYAAFLAVVLYRSLG